MSGTPVQASCKRSISETVRLPTVRADVRQQHVAFKYIDVFYNRIRRHAKIRNQIPAIYAQQFTQQSQEKAA